MRPDGSGTARLRAGAVQCSCEGPGVREPVLRVRFTTPTDDVGDRRLDAIEQDLTGIGIVDVDGIPSGEQDEQRCAQCIDVGTCRGLLAVDPLLGRHEGRRPEGGLGPGEASVRRRDPGQTEIGQFDRVRTDQEIVRLDVPMDHALIVCVGQRIGDVEARGKCDLHSQWTIATHPSVQGTRRQVLHHDEGRKGLVALIEDPDDARVVQLRHGDGLGPEPGTHVRPD